MCAKGPQELHKTSTFYSRCKKCDIEKTLGGCVPSPLGSPKVNNLRFADHIDLLEYSHEKLQENVHELNMAAQRAGLKINVDKTKAMVFGEETWKLKCKMR